MFTYTEHKENGLVIHWTAQDSNIVTLGTNDRSEIEGRSGPFEVSDEEGSFELCRSELYFDFDEGFACLNIYPSYDEIVNTDLLKAKHKCIDLSVSWYHTGAFHGFTVSSTFNEGCFSEEEHSNELALEFIWTLDDTDNLLEANLLEANLQRFRDAVKSNGVNGVSRIDYAISGYPLDVDTTHLEPYQPAKTQLKRPLTSLATLAPSSDSDYVCLAPCMPANETRVLRAHRQILCRASSYFNSLLDSDFAEASAFRQSDERDVVSSSLQTVTRNDSEPALKRARGDFSGQAHSVPTVKVPESSYEQLQMMLFSMYTGLHLFVDHDYTQPVRGASSMATLAGEDTSTSRQLAKRSKKPKWQDLMCASDPFDMYRIAEMYGVDALRTKALGHIRSHIDLSRLSRDFEDYEEILLSQEIRDAYRDFCKTYKHLIETQCADHAAILEVFGIDSADVSAREADDTAKEAKDVAEETDNSPTKAVGGQES